MKICEVSTLLAYIASMYIMACIFYMIISRHYGTPFNDALKSYPDLIKIKNDSKNKRYVIFYTGIILSIIGLCILKPFGECY
uniref:Uncharacterized protein n=1 Tax=viral metagenome TaxID=1070528 RepID=A0A6C0ELB7_9ZZZZ